MSTKVVLSKVRLSYVNLVEPKQFDGQEAKYSCMVLVPKNDKKNLVKVKKAIDEAYSDAKGGKLKGVSREKVYTTFRDADENFDVEEHPEFEGCYYMNVSSRTKPGLIDKHKVKSNDPEDFYSGVYANVSVNFYAYNHAGNKGITCGLNNVMSLGTGEYLGGRASAESDFAEFSAVEDDDFMGADTKKDEDDELLDEFF